MQCPLCLLQRFATVWNQVLWEIEFLLYEYQLIAQWETFSFLKIQLKAGVITD